jgi:hypothetical protein
MEEHPLFEQGDACPAIRLPLQQFEAMDKAFCDLPNVLAASDTIWFKKKLDMIWINFISGPTKGLFWNARR